MIRLIDRTVIYVSWRFEMSYKSVIVEANGMKISGCAIFTSKYQGFDPVSKKRIKPGDTIAYKHKDQLTASQRQAIWPNGQCYNLTVLWPQEVDVENTKSSFEPSEYQQDICRALIETDDHIIIEALAGSGKTATLVWLVKELKKRGLDSNKRYLYMAFGKRDQMDLAERLSGFNVDVLTTHSFGFRILKNSWGTEIAPKNSAQFYGDMFLRLLCDNLGLAYTAKNFKKARGTSEYALRSGVIELIGYIKNWALFPQKVKDGYAFNQEQLEEIRQYIYMYEIEPPEEWHGGYEEWQNMLINFASEITCLSIPIEGQELFEIAFDDMLYLPLILNLELPYYDLVFTDESQDFNACQVLLLERLQKVEQKNCA